MIMMAMITKIIIKEWVAIPKCVWVTGTRTSHGLGFPASRQENIVKTSKMEIERLSLFWCHFVRLRQSDYFIGFLIVQRHVSINSDRFQALIWQNIGLACLPG